MECQEARDIVKKIIQGEAVDGEQREQAEAHIQTCEICLERFGRIAETIVMQKADCTHYLEQIPDYVEAQLEDRQDLSEFTELQSHLDICEECVEAYALLFDTMYEAQMGMLEEVDEVPGTDLSFMEDNSETNGVISISQWMLVLAKLRFRRKKKILLGAKRPSRQRLDPLVILIFTILILLMIGIAIWSGFFSNLYNFDLIFMWVLKLLIPKPIRQT